VAEDIQWRFEMSREVLPRLQQSLEWALQRQNQRIVQALPTERRPLAERQRLVTRLAVAGLLIMVLLYLLDPAGFLRSPGMFVIAFLFVGGLVAARFLPQIRAWSRRTAGSMLTAQAARTFRSVEKQAPYTIEYRLSGDHLEARVEKLKLVRQLDLRAAARVLYTPDALFAFRRDRAAAPFRFVYTPGDDERSALLAAFARCGVTAEPIEGDVDGYVAPIATARVHRE